jgi:hypothetical protein
LGEKIAKFLISQKYGGKKHLERALGVIEILNVHQLMKVKFQLSNFHHIDFETTSWRKMGMMVLNHCSSRF